MGTSISSPSETFTQNLNRFYHKQQVEQNFTKHSHPHNLENEKISSHKSEEKENVKVESSHNSIMTKEFEEEEEIPVEPRVSIKMTTIKGSMQVLKQSNETTGIEAPICNIPRMKVHLKLAPLRS